MKQPDLSIASREELIKFIKYQQSCLDGVDELSKSLMYASSVLAEDIHNLADGNGWEWVTGEKEGEDFMKSTLTILRGDPKDKTFDQLMTVFSNFGNKIMALSGKSKKTVEERGVKTTPNAKLKPGDNMFEHVVKQVKKNGNSNI